MGHLINPIAFRLGINKSWENIWYIKNIYYAEYLHNILNFRNFIYNYFKKKKFLKRGILLSEFFIYRYGKKHVLNIYLYIIDLEKQANLFINLIYQNYYNGIYNNRFKLPRNF
jgi:hypothetical protein